MVMPLKPGLSSEVNLARVCVVLMETIDSGLIGSRKDAVKGGSVAAALPGDPSLPSGSTSRGWCLGCNAGTPFSLLHLETGGWLCHVTYRSRLVTFECSGLRSMQSKALCRETSEEPLKTGIFTFF